MVQGGLPTGTDHKWAVARAVAESGPTAPASVFRLRASVGRPPVGEAGPAHLLGGVQAARGAPAQLYHGG